jgi:predicted ester cyclase
MTHGSTEQLVRAVVALANEHRLEDVPRTANFVNHSHFQGRSSGTADELPDRFRKQYAAFPDLRKEIQEVYADGDVGVVRLLLRGTHLGEYRGLAPTGRSFEVQAIEIFRFDGGALAEHWAVVGELGATPAVFRVTD